MAAGDEGVLVEHGSAMTGLLKTLGKRLLDNPAGDQVRSFLGLKPLFVVRPWRRDAAVSDLFPWRCDEQ